MDFDQSSEYGQAGYELYCSHGSSGHDSSSGVDSCDCSNESDDEESSSECGHSDKDEDHSDKDEDHSEYCKPLPAFAINDVSVSESAGLATFTVTRSGSLSGKSTVQFATSNLTAVAGEDYTSATGVLSFGPNETSKTVSVTILEDSLVESDETFKVILSNAKAGKIGDATGIGTITNDDVPPPPPPPPLVVNQAPAGTDRTITLLEDTSHTFVAAEFGFTDPNDSPANGLKAVRLATVPLVGSLTLGGVGVFAGDLIPVAQIGSLRFSPAANGFGNGYASFTFQVQDDGGTANGGIDLDPTPNRITLDVTGVNDVPVFVTETGDPIGTDPDPGAGYAFSYSENRTTTDALGRVYASDVDSESLSFSILTNVLSDSAPLFAIDPTSGVISLTAAGVAAFTNDFETSPNVHEILVQVSDGQGSSQAKVTLTETDLAEPPIDPPVAQSPVAVSDLLSVVSGGELSASIVANDISRAGQTLSVVVVNGIRFESLAVSAARPDFREVQLQNGALFIKADGSSTYVHAGRRFTVTPIAAAGTVELRDGNGVWRLLTAPTEITLQQVKDGGLRYTPSASAVGATFTTVASVVEIDTSGDSFTYTVADGAGESNTATVTYTIVDPSRMPADTGSVTEDVAVIYRRVPVGNGLSGEESVIGFIEAKGRLDGSFVPGNISGAYGTLALAADGGWTYSADNWQSAIQSLNAGQTLVDVIPVSDTVRVTVTIHGADEIYVGVDDDLDGISNATETILANKALGAAGLEPQLYTLNLDSLIVDPLSVTGALNVFAPQDSDLNRDGTADAIQNAVTTFAWINSVNYAAGNASPESFGNTKAVVNMVAEATASSRGVENPAAQLFDVEAIPLNEELRAALRTLMDFTPGWSPLGFGARVRDGAGVSNIDVDPGRAGSQWRFTVDLSRTGETSPSFFAYFKWIDDATIAAYRGAGLPLVDLDGLPITAKGWYDFTARPGNGDGGRMILDGSRVLGVELVITDNAFGDNNLAVGSLLDPGIPVFFNGLLPTAADQIRTIAAGTPYIFSPTDFGFADANPENYRFGGVRITSLPAAGSLLLDGLPVAANQFVSTEKIPGLTFVPAADAGGDAYAAFDFLVRSSSGASAATGNRFTFNVTPESENPNGAGPETDLSVSATNGVTTFIPGSTLTYTVTVLNSGPDSVANAIVGVPLPVGIVATTWSAELAGATIATGSGAIRQPVSLAPGQSAVFTIIASVSPFATEGVALMAAVDPPADAVDTDPSNNAVIDADVMASPGTSLVFGSDIGCNSQPVVTIIDQQTGEVRQFQPFEKTFIGGIRTATFDLDRDGYDEIFVAAGRGRASEVRVFTQWGTELPAFRTLLFPSNYTGGVEIAVGTIGGRDYLAAAMSAGRSEVRLFPISASAVEPVAKQPVASFQPFGARFAGGATVAFADVGTFVGGATRNATAADGSSELVIGSGAGMKATVRIYDMSSGRPRLVDTINPFNGSAGVGVVTVSVGRFNADSVDDLIVASGQGGGSRVEIYSGRIDDKVDARLAAVAPFAKSRRKNAAVTAAGVDTNQDGVIDSLAVGQGFGGELGKVTQVALSNQLRTAAVPLRTSGIPQTPIRVGALNNRPIASQIAARARQAADLGGAGDPAGRQAAFAELAREWGGSVNPNGFRRS